jgi:hypothetical protein
MCLAVLNNDGPGRSICGPLGRPYISCRRQSEIDLREDRFEFGRRSAIIGDAPKNQRQQILGQARRMFEPERVKTSGKSRVLGLATCMRV